MGEKLEAQVEAILTEVKSGGDEALRRLTQRFDGVDIPPQELRVPPERCCEAFRLLPVQLQDALREAAARIRRYHEATRPKDNFIVGPDGELLAERWIPLESVGIYAPGGRASYPSTVLMTVIPAQAAGVSRIAVCSPPGPDGVSPLIAAACGLLEVEELYQVGGVQAVGALAYGTQTIGAVDKIVGPGNKYVTCAKKLLFGTVGIDMLAGPSEVVVVADQSAPLGAVAAELLAQAEHDPETRVFCFTVGGLDPGALKEQALLLAEGLPAHVRQVLNRAEAFRRFDSLREALAEVNRIAPEHLSLQVADPFAALAEVRNAGAVMLGSDTPVAFSDYLAGPSHVLPTGRTARFSSGLGTRDFMKAQHVVMTPRSCRSRWAEKVALLARSEGLEAHARSVLPPQAEGREEK